jgi:hypothetical protein
MAIRKVSHHKKVISKKKSSVASINPYSVIEFRYRAKDKNNYDRNPLVFVLLKKAGIVTGININYLKEYAVQRLLEEKNLKRLVYYKLYDHAFRTYKISNMLSIKLVEYEMDAISGEEQVKEKKRKDVTDMEIEMKKGLEESLGNKKTPQELKEMKQKAEEKDKKTTK